MNLAALIFVPFIAWHAYRAGHGIKTGVFKSLGGAVDRASMPVVFWFWVTREVVLGTLFVAMSVTSLLKLGTAMLVWLFAGSVVVYATILLVTTYRLLRRSNGSPDCVKTVGS